MRFPALQCVFPEVFVHMFTPFSTNVKQNKTEKDILGRFGLGIVAGTEDISKKSHLRDLAKPQYSISQGGSCRPLGAAPAFICDSLGMSPMLGAMKVRFVDPGVSQNPEMETESN